MKQEIKDARGRVVGSFLANLPPIEPDKAGPIDRQTRNLKGGLKEIILTYAVRRHEEYKECPKWRAAWEAMANSVSWDRALDEASDQAIYTIRQVVTTTGEFVTNQKAEEELTKPKPKEPKGRRIVWDKEV